MGAIIYVGGGESPQQKKLIAAKCPHVLISFYWLQKLKPDQVAELFERYPPGVGLLIDSGAYTLRQDKPGSTWSDESNIYRYADKYETFLHKYRKRLATAVHLDLATRVGQSQVDAWDRGMFKELEDDGLPIIKVYHEGEHSIRDWTRMCEENQYVGITGFEGLDNVTTLFSTAKKYKTKVHGFACTKFEMLKRLPFYSVDSVTWIMGEKYGDTFVFKGNGLKRFEDKTLRRQYRTHFINMGLDWDKIKKEEPTEIAKMNLGAWMEAQKWLDTHTGRLNYWEQSSTLVEHGEALLEALPVSPIVEESKRERVEKALPSGVVARRYDPALFPGRPSEERGKPFEKQLQDIEERRWRARTFADNPHALPKKGTFKLPTGESKMSEGQAQPSDVVADPVIADRNEARPMIVDGPAPSAEIPVVPREVPVVDNEVHEAVAYNPEQQAVYDKAQADGFSVLESMLKVSNMNKKPPVVEVAPTPAPAPKPKPRLELISEE